MKNHEYHTGSILNHKKENTDTDQSAEPVPPLKLGIHYAIFQSR